MDETLGKLGGTYIDAGVAAATIASLSALAMMLSRQPSRRRALARAGVLGSLLVIPLVFLRPYPPVDLATPLAGLLRRVRWPIAVDVDRPIFRYGLALWRILGPTLLIGYVAGLIVGSARLALGWFGSGWIARNSEEPTAETRAFYEAIPCAVRRRPRLRVSSRTSRPVLLGSTRTTLLIPPALDRPGSSVALRLSLLHELAHVEAADPSFSLLMEVASVFWFWLPPLWWIRRQARLDQEFLADRRAAGRLGAPSRYASALISIAAVSGGEASQPPPADRPGVRSSLRERVLLLIRSPFSVEGEVPRAWLAVLSVTTAALLVSVSSLTFRASTGSPSRPRPAGDVRRLVLPEISLQATGRDAPPIVLPVRLPEVFDLQFEVLASPGQLAEIEVLGLALAASPASQPSSAEPTPAWHRVEISRRDGRARLSVDSPARQADCESAQAWLELRAAASEPTSLRSLVLAW